MSAPIALSGAKQLREINIGLADLIRPPRRISVADCAAEHVRTAIDQWFDPTTTPYMIEPMNKMADRQHDVVCFCGPQRSGKTYAMVLGGMAYFVVAHPLDFAIVHSSQNMAASLSDVEVTRMQQHSPAIHAAMTGRTRDNNTHRKRYRSGIVQHILWPSPTELASRTIHVMILTDYGRWPSNIGGGASGFEESRKRTQTVGSLAMTAVEGAPRCEVTQEDDTRPQKYELGKPLRHRFPATIGKPYGDICPIYNTGDKRWWYVPCTSCGEYYPQDPSIERFQWAGETYGTACPWCGSIHEETTKHDENAAGIWLAEGQVIDWQGHVKSINESDGQYPSYALGGGAAAYQTRRSIIYKYLAAKQTAEETGDENSLKQIVNSDIGAPYVPLLRGAPRDSRRLKDRAAPIGKKQVPANIRFVVMTVDVQANRFVCQAIGYGEDRQRAIVDRFSIVKSNRTGDDGERFTVNPGAYAEDWLLLTELLEKSYQLSDGSGRRLQVVTLGVDSGGQDKATENAVAWWRGLSPGQKTRARLVKGEHKPSAPAVDQRWPDTRGRSDRAGATQGDVPILFINVNQVKDLLASDLERNDPGPGFVSFPDWLPDWFYAELTREKRDKNGKWSAKGRNEAWDLLVYGEALARVGFPFRFRPFLLTGINAPGFWSNPPRWAQTWDKNGMVFGKDEQKPASADHYNRPRQRPRKGLFS